MKSSKTHRKRFLLVPGYIKSRNDGDIHFVGVSELLYLYQCKIEDCVVMSSDNHSFRDIKAYAVTHELRILKPLDSGAYWPVDKPRLDVQIMKFIKGITKRALRHG